MTRDMNLLRAILIQAESGTPFTTLDGYPDDAVRYHIALAHEAGLLHALIQRQPPTPVLLSAQAFDLTWAGHEFVSVARDDTNWNNLVIPIPY